MVDCSPTAFLLDDFEYQRLRQVALHPQWHSDLRDFPRNWVYNTLLTLLPYRTKAPIILTMGSTSVLPLQSAWQDQQGLRRASEEVFRLTQSHMGDVLKEIMRGVYKVPALHGVKLLYKARPEACFLGDSPSRGGVDVTIDSGASRSYTKI